MRPHAAAQGPWLRGAQPHAHHTKRPGLTRTPISPLCSAWPACRTRRPRAYPPPPFHAAAGTRCPRPQTVRNLWPHVLEKHLADLTSELLQRLFNEVLQKHAAKAPWKYIGASERSCPAPARAARALAAAHAPAGARTAAAAHAGVRAHSMSCQHQQARSHRAWCTHARLPCCPERIMQATQNPVDPTFTT